MSARRRWAVAPPLAASLVLAACGGGSEDDVATTASDTSAGSSGSSGSSESSESSSGASTVSGTVTVFAAASLTDAFTTIADDFSAANPDAEVVLSFAGSSALAQQIVSGAPADVFAAASPATMATVTDAGGAASPEVFVTNTLQIAVPPGNPGGITGLAEFADPERTVALCAAEVPCGAASATVFEAAGLTPAPDTLEQDVRAALSKVELGEVDGALVYRTDVLASGDAVEGIDFPEAAEAVNDYPIAALAEAPNPDAAQAFVAYVTSEEGQGVLADAGFTNP